MKILLANNKLRYLGGSETFTYTLAGQLVSEGHRVDAFTFRQGLISDRMKKDFGVRITQNPGKYDIVLANHTTTVKELKERNTGYILQTCHGVTTVLEQPSPFAGSYVAISQELADHVKGITEKETPVILNGINCSRFTPLIPLRKYPRRVLSLVHDDGLNSRLAALFARYHIRLAVLNKLKNPVWDMENRINQADMVVSLGRGAYEAMACGRPVLVLDKRPGRELKGDGIILPDNIGELIYCNCRGQARQNTNITEMVEFSIEHYSPALGDWCRSYAVRNLNIIKQTAKYIKLCKELTWYMC